MKLRLDLHVHTIYSDGRGTVNDVIRTAQIKGLDGIAITDHGTLEGALKARGMSGELLVIPGCEVSTHRGHLIALGIANPLPRHLDYEEMLELTRCQGGLAVLAHPYAGRPKEAIWERHKPDAVETVNALQPFFNHFTRKSEILAKNLNLPQVGGSDAHVPKCVGDAYTVIATDSKDVEGVIRGISKGLSTADGHPSSLLMKIRIGLGFVLTLP